MFLPYAPEFLTDLATSAIEGACWASDVTDQFLTMVSMDDPSSFDGESDFGTLTRLDLDEEIRVVLTLIDRHGTDESTWDSSLSWAGAEVVIGEGGSQKWWSDFYIVTPEEADEAQARFSEAYSQYLGCEDCGSPDGECICDFDETIGPYAIGTAVSVESYPGIGWRVDRYVPNGEVQCHMIGDDRTFSFDPTALRPLADEAFCSECGQIGCQHGNV